MLHGRLPPTVHVVVPETLIIARLPANGFLVGPPVFWIESNAPVSWIVSPNWSALVTWIKQLVVFGTVVSQWFCWHSPVAPEQSLSVSQTLVWGEHCFAMVMP